MNRLGALVIALAGAVLLASTACAPKGEGLVTLRLWAMGREGEVVGELVRDFEREHPNVRVLVQQMPWSAAHEKLLTSYVGRATPDVSQLGNSWIAEFAALNALEPLDPWIARSGALRDTGYFRGIWDTNVIDGTTFGVPWYVDTRVLFYRTDILARAGYREVPQSWDEWREAMRAIKRVVGPDRYAVFLPFNEWMQPAIFGLQCGSPLLGDDATRGAFREPEFRRAFDFYIGLYAEGLAPAYGNNDVANLYQEFERGTFSMYITGPWNLGEFARRLPDSLQNAWSTAPLPGPTGPSSGLSFAGGSSLVVYRGSRHKAEAWQLVEFLSRPEQQVRFWRLTGNLPARREAWADTALARDARMRAFATQLGRTASTPKLPEWEFIATRLLEQSERAIRRTTPPDSALATLDRIVDQLLEKRRWLIARREKREGGAS